MVGCHVFILQQKLKRLKISFKDWNKNVSGNVHEVVVDKQKSFFLYNIRFRSDPTEMDMLLGQHNKLCKILIWL